MDTLWTHFALSEFLAFLGFSKFYAGFLAGNN